MLPTSANGLTQDLPPSREQGVSAEGVIHAAPGNYVGREVTIQLRLGGIWAFLEEIFWTTASSGSLVPDDLRKPACVDNLLDKLVSPR